MGFFINRTNTFEIVSDTELFNIVCRDEADDTLYGFNIGIDGVVSSQFINIALPGGYEGGNIGYADNDFIAGVIKTDNDISTTNNSN